MAHQETDRAPPSQLTPSGLLALLMSMVPSLSIGVLGALVFFVLGWPSPWLCGSMVAMALAALAGLDSRPPKPVMAGAFLLLGASMGASITADLLTQMAHWPLSLAVLAVTVPVVVAAVQLFLTRFAGWEPREALLAAMPGALSYAVGLAAESGLDVRRVAIAQTLRLFLVVALLPWAFGGSPGALAHHLNRPPDAEMAGILAIAISAVALAGTLHWLRVPSPALLGGLAASGVLHATGLVSTAIPQAILIPAMILTGTSIGSRFAGTELVLLRAILAAALGAIAIAISISALGAIAAATLIGVPVGQAMLAFAPGGLEAAAILGFSLGYDPAYVATHQLARFLGIALLLPFVFGRLAPHLVRAKAT
jgi:uncharacterized protein